jgi:broad specificity phosphatase PhoE
MEENKFATLYLVRHGETDWNAQKRIQGRVDRPLNKTGKQQAHAVGQKLASVRAAAISASPLLRAKHTAELIASYQACALAFDHDLQEANYGSIEGYTVSEFHEQFSDLLEKRKKLTFEEWWISKVPHDAESPAEIIGRVLPVLQRIATAHPGESAFIVTHGFVMRSLIAYLNKDSDKGIHVSNGEILILKGEQLFRKG